MSAVLHGKRILVVDDDLDLGALFGLCLEMSGAAVSLATDAASAMRALDLCQPDALVLDRGLPDVDGLTLLGLIRAQPGFSNVPALARHRLRPRAGSRGRDERRVRRISAEAG